MWRAAGVPAGDPPGAGVRVPRAGRPGGQDDLVVLELSEAFRGAGVGDDATLRLLAVYADSLRRITKAEAEFYEANVERRMRASGLASLVNDISRSRGGRPVRWLGDGGMFHFPEPGPAVTASLDMVERAPAADLPAAHVGIHTGPVVFQDGDVYGRTVNLAARISSYAKAGQVVVSEDTVRRCGDTPLSFDPLGPVSLKGVARP